MSVFDTKRKLLDFPCRLNTLKRLVAEHSRFNVRLSPGVLGVNTREICQKILNPLIPFIDLIVIYDLQKATREFKKFQSHFTLRHGRYELDMGGHNWEYFRPLLYKPLPFSSIQEVRGSILLRCRNRGLPWKEMFTRCSGPYIYHNPSVASGRAALQYVKRNMERSLVFVIIDKLNSGLESLTIVSERSEIATIFDIASRTCRWPRAEQYEIPENERIL